MLGDAGFAACSRIEEATKLTFERLAVVSPCVKRVESWSWEESAGTVEEDWVFCVISSQQYCVCHRDSEGGSQKQTVVGSTG